MKTTSRAYNKQWYMWFNCEEERQEFITAIVRAEKNIEEGNYYTQKEVEEIFRDEFRIE